MAKKKESILILGLGGIGFYLAKWLTHEGYSITAIEADRDLVDLADGEVDARLIHADAMSFACWKSVQASRMDYVIAVTDNDAVNITACLIADKCGIKRKIARVRSLELWGKNPLLSADDLKINKVIRPDELCAQEIARQLDMRSGSVVVDIGEDMRVVATRITSDSILADRTLKDIAQQHDGASYRIVAIARDVDTLIPGGDDRVLYDDLVFLLTHRNDQPRLEKLLGIRKQRRHRVMILGGGQIGRRVAELLQGSMPVRLIERDAARAEELSHQLGRTEVFHGDASDSETLLQGGLLDMDTVITATGDNETNIMAGVMARHLIKCRKGNGEGERLKTIALVKKEEYLALASAMGADIVLNRKVLAGNQILKYIRRGKLLSVAHLHGCEAEVVELVADRGAPITRKPLWELGAEMKGRMIIGGFFRGKTWKIAVGSSQIEAGDRVVGICASRDLPELERLFDR